MITNVNARRITWGGTARLRHRRQCCILRQVRVPITTVNTVLASSHPLVPARIIFASAIPATLVSSHNPYYYSKANLNLQFFSFCEFFKMQKCVGSHHSEWSNLELPIFRYFQISIIKITKDELFNFSFSNLLFINLFKLLKHYKCMIIFHNGNFRTFDSFPNRQTLKIYFFF